MKNINFTKVLVLTLACILLPLATAAAQEAEQSTRAAAPKIKNKVDISGDTVISSEGEITVVPTVIDLELHNEALILKSIGTPLYDTGGVLLGVSAAAWVLWTLTILPSLFTGLIAEFVPTARAAVATLSQSVDPLFYASISLTAIGTAFLIAGGVLNIHGDAKRERSFAANSVR